MDDYVNMYLELMFVAKKMADYLDNHLGSDPKATALADEYDTLIRKHTGL